MSAPPADRALVELLTVLQRRDYRFVTTTPATHARVLARPERREARDLEDVLGWSLPFAPGAIDPEVVDLLERAGQLVSSGDGAMRSAVRVSSLGAQLYLHSSYPTDSADAVFFGPDSYRFARLLHEVLRGLGEPPAAIGDIGTGAGVGAITAAKLCPGARIVASDVNSEALRFARINAAAAGCEIETVLGPMLEPFDGTFDLIIANPPYIADPGERDYRDGGAMHGGQLSLDMVRAALPRLNPGGTMILYSGSAIGGGHDALKTALVAEAANRHVGLTYHELDPDVFGEELEQPLYRSIERIAVVAAVFTAPASPRPGGP